MKKAILILNTIKNKSFAYLTNKIEISYNLKTFYLDEMKSITKKGIINEINSYIKNQDIDICFFQGDYISYIDVKFIKSIEAKKKILFSTDDFDTHEVNLINATACDIVLSTCPASTLRFEEKILETYFVPLESDDKILRNYSTIKNNDILFFGKIKADRKEYIDKLKLEKFKFKILGTDNSNTLSEEELAKEISNSKIILNFSQTGNRNKFYSHKTIPLSNLQMKARPIMAGLCGSFCISEYSPQTKMVYGDICPTFKNYGEMIDLIKKFLSDSSLLETKTKEFVELSSRYADSIYFPKIARKINNCEVKNKIFYKTPFWYNYIFLKKSIQLFFKSIRRNYLKK